MRIRLALLFASLVLGAAIAVAVVQATDEEWHAHQNTYLETAMKRARIDSVKAAIAETNVEIRQDMLQGFGEEARFDRCRTCHVAIEDQTFADGEHPLKAHPTIPVHPFNEFGCTICHDGNGRGLTRFDAHGDDPFWESPMLKRPYIEASCARCHAEPFLDETPHLRAGRALFEEYACSECHTIAGISRGKLGPELTEVGHHQSLSYMHESIIEPEANAPMTQMPTFPILRDVRINLVVFLKSRQGHYLYESPVSRRIATKRWKQLTPPEVAASAEAGQNAFSERPCLSCHMLGGEDGQLAPELDYIGRLRDSNYMVEHLTDPRAHVTGSKMPTFWMHESERRALSLYLATLHEITVPSTPRERFSKVCTRCHGVGGAGDGMIADNLLPRPRDFTNKRFFNWIPEDRARHAILKGIPGTSMPPFESLFSADDADALFAWVRTNFTKVERRPQTKGRNIPESSAVAYSEESVARGRAAFAQRCYGCHGRRGDGKGPNATDLVPRPRDLASTAFMSGLTDSRMFESITYGVIGTGMPPWDYLPESDRWNLINFIRDISKTGSAVSQPRREGDE